MCHVLSCSPCRRRCSAVPFPHIAPSLALPCAPVRPRPPVRGPQAAGQFLRAYRACAPVPARASCAGAVRAPDCAREAKGAGPPRKRGRGETKATSTFDSWQPLQPPYRRPGRSEAESRGLHEAEIRPHKAPDRGRGDSGGGSPLPSLPLAGRSVRGRTPALCHDLSCSPCRRRSSAVPFLHIVLSIAFRCAPSRPRRRRLRAPPGGGTSFCARILRARPRPSARLSAPARFAHLIARARRRAHVSPPFPPGLFSAPAIVSLRRKAKRRPRKPPSLCLHSTTVSLQSSPPAGEI